MKRFDSPICWDPILEHCHYLHIGDLWIGETWGVDKKNFVALVLRVFYFISWDRLRESVKLVARNAMFTLQSERLYKLWYMIQVRLGFWTFSRNTLTVLFPAPVGPIILRSWIVNQRVFWVSWCVNATYSIRHVLYPASVAGTRSTDIGPSSTTRSSIEVVLSPITVRWVWILWIWVL